MDQISFHYKRDLHIQGEIEGEILSVSRLGKKMTKLIY